MPHYDRVSKHLETNAVVTINTHAADLRLPQSKQRREVSQMGMES